MNTERLLLSQKMKKKSKMRKSIIIATLFLAACSSPDLTEIKEQQKKLESKIDSLENVVHQLEQNDSLSFSILNEYVLKPQPGSLLYELENQQDK